MLILQIFPSVCVWNASHAGHSGLAVVSLTTKEAMVTWPSIRMTTAGPWVRPRADISLEEIPEPAREDACQKVKPWDQTSGDLGPVATRPLLTL